MPRAFWYSRRALSWSPGCWRTFPMFIKVTSTSTCERGEYLRENGKRVPVARQLRKGACSLPEQTENSDKIPLQSSREREDDQGECCPGIHPIWKVGMCYIT